MGKLEFVRQRREGRVLQAEGTACMKVWSPDRREGGRPSAETGTSR